ncbi:MAG: ATP-binding protein [Anaerolineales bacterium]
MKDAGVVATAGKIIQNVVQCAVECIGWIMRDTEGITIVGGSGAYVSRPEVQRKIREYLAAAPPQERAAESLSARELGLSHRYTFVLLSAPVGPSDGAEPPISSINSMGLMLALPYATSLDKSQREALLEVAALMGQAMAHQQAFGHVHRQEERTQAAFAVIRELSELLYPDKLLERAVRSIANHLGFEWVSVFLIDENGGYAVLRAVNHENGAAWAAEHHRLKIRSSHLVGSVTQTGQVRALSALDSSRQDQISATLAPGMCAELSAPMRYHGEVIGVVDVQSAQPDGFSAGEMAVLQIIADQLTRALISARQHEAVWQRLEEAQMLRELVVNTAGRDQSGVLKPTLQLLRSQMPYTYQAFFQRRGDLLYAASDSYWPEGELSLAETPWKRVCEGQLFYRTASQPMAWAGGARTVIAAPIHANGHVQGILAVAHNEPIDISPEAIHFLETVATQLEVLLQHARHYEASSRSEQLLRQLINAEMEMLAAYETPVILDIFSRTLLSKIRGVVEIGLFVENDKEDGSGEQGDTLVWTKRAATPDLAEPTYLSNFITMTGVKRLTSGMQRAYVILPEMQHLIRERYTELSGVMDHLPPYPVSLHPLQTKNRKVGLLLIAVEQPRRDEDLRERMTWIQALANQAALILDNAQLLARLRQQTRELKQAYKDARLLNEIRLQMIQNVSHELRTPLGLISGYANVLIEEDVGPLTTKQKEMLNTITRRAQSLHRMVESLTSLKGRVELTTVLPINIYRLFNMVIAEFKSQAEAQGVRFEMEIPPDLPYVPGNLDRLRLAFTHLIENAVKFSAEGGVVTIQGWSTPDAIILAISDQGIGIDSENLELIFERFYQVDGSTTRRFGGMGIGLSVVWEIIEAHGGHIEVESVKDRGSTFTVTMPRKLTRTPLSNRS